MHKVSVIIPTYNRAGTLLRAVRSALAQSHPPHEVLVCDDGSTDDSEKQVKATNDPRVKWIACGRNGMPSVPRNTGIKHAAGNWIAFLDSDDEWLPSKLERQLAALEKSECLASCTNANRIVVGQNRGTYHAFEARRITFSGLVAVNNIICSSVLVKKDLLAGGYLFPEGKEYKAIEDYALWLRLSLKTDFDYLSEPLVNYTDDPTSSVRANYADVWDIRKVIFGGLRQWIHEQNVQLTSAQQKLVSQAAQESEARGKKSLWQRVKQKLK
jgi:teichuronic acid biosynthesis glycosyltransferase TuaG